MAVKKAKAKANKTKVKETKKAKTDEEMEGGASLDDAFSDDDDVEYAENKPKKVKKGMSEEEIEEDLDAVEEVMNGHSVSSGEHAAVIIKSSKPIAKIKKGDKIKIDGKEYEVDSHYALMDHGSTKEMAIELFDPKTDKDYQLRYFDDQVETTLDFYELQEILYVKRAMIKIEW